MALLLRVGLNDGQADPHYTMKVQGRARKRLDRCYDSNWCHYQKSFKTFVQDDKAETNKTTSYQEAERPVVPGEGPDKDQDLE